MSPNVPVRSFRPQLSRLYCTFSPGVLQPTISYSTLSLISSLTPLSSLSVLSFRFPVTVFFHGWWWWPAAWPPWQCRRRTVWPAAWGAGSPPRGPPAQVGLPYGTPPAAGRRWRPTSAGSSGLHPALGATGERGGQKPERAMRRTQMFHQVGRKHWKWGTYFREERGHLRDSGMDLFRTWNKAREFCTINISFGINSIAEHICP